MTIAVIDGMGGGIGAQLIARLAETVSDGHELIALGTNSIATDRMIRSGAHRGATGENAIRVSSNLADIIVAPIGVVVPDSMMGEITSLMAQSVLSSRAKKILIPIGQQHFTIAGLEQKPVGALIAEAVDIVRGLLN